MPESAVDEVLEPAMRARHIPGVGLAVVVDGELTLAKGYGFANLEHAVPATADTVSLIASITKTFTAVATMMLVESGDIALEQPIGTHLPEIPASWHPVTVRQLLDHTSGIPNLTAFDTPPCPRTAPAHREAATHADVLAEVACLPLDFPPGRGWAYCDTGYYLLGMLIERVSEETYEQFLRKRVFEPCGMTRTRLLDQDTLVTDRAAGYVFEDGAFRNGPRLEPIEEFAYGGILSTARDLTRWDRALRGDRLLRRATFEHMWTLTAVGDVPYGLGFSLRTLDGHAHRGHTGGGPSASTAFAWFPDDHVTVILLTNAGQSGNFVMRDVALEVAQLFFAPTSDAARAR